MNARIALLLVGICWLSVSLSWAQVASQIVVSPEHFDRESRAIALDKHWKYHLGDQASWADPAYDDRDWDILGNPWMVPEAQPLGPAGRPGIVWLQLHLAVATSLWDTPLALHVFQRGVGDIYLDGERIHQFGEVGMQGTDVDVWYLHR